MDLPAPIADSRRGRHTIKVIVDGKEATQYYADNVGRVSSCWIESIHGAEFSVVVEEHQTVTPATSLVEVYADGVKVGRAIVKADRRCQFLGSWLDKYTLKPFKFTRAESIDHDLYPRGFIRDMDEGKITVKISEVALHSISNWMDPPPPLPELPKAIFSGEERGWHRVTLSPGSRTQAYTMQASKLSVVPFDPAATSPIVVVEFMYRPRSYLLLKLCGEPSQEMTKPVTVVKSLPLKRPRPSHDLGVIEGTALKRPYSSQRQGGATEATKNMYNVRSDPQVEDNSLKHLEYRKTYDDALKVINISGRERKRALQPRGISTEPDLISLRPKPLASVKVRIIEDKSASNASSTDGVLRHKSYVGANLAKGQHKKPTRRPEFKDAIQKREITDDNVEPAIVTVISDGEQGNAAIIRQMTSFNQADENSRLPASQIDQGRRLLSSMRRWTNNLMGIAVEGSRSNPVAEMAEDLIGYTDQKYRTLQAMVLKAKKPSA